MNIHILLVMKWLNDKDSVTQEELRANRESAYTAPADADYIGAVTASSIASAFADSGNSEDAEYWVDKFFVYSGESKQDYINELNKGEE